MPRQKPRWALTHRNYDVDRRNRFELLSLCIVRDNTIPTLLSLDVTTVLLWRFEYIYNCRRHACQNTCRGPSPEEQSSTHREMKEIEGLCGGCCYYSIYGTTDTRRVKFKVFSHAIDLDRQDRQTRCFSRYSVRDSFYKWSIKIPRSSFNRSGRYLNFWCENAFSKA